MTHYTSFALHAAGYMLEILVPFQLFLAMFVSYDVLAPGSPSSTQIRHKKLERY
jgi:hypothetical protein